MVREFAVIVSDNDTDKICEIRMFETADAAQLAWRDIRNDLYSKGLELDFSVWVYRSVDALQI